MNEPVGCIGTCEPLYVPTKQEILETIAKGARENNPDQLRIFFDGHGVCGSGNFATGDGDIKLKDVYAVLKKENYNKWVQIDINFPYAGFWLKDAKKLE